MGRKKEFRFYLETEGEREMSSPFLVAVIRAPSLVFVKGTSTTFSKSERHPVVRWLRGIVSPVLADRVF